MAYNQNKMPGDTKHQLIEQNIEGVPYCKWLLNQMMDELQAVNRYSDAYNNALDQKEKDTFDMIRKQENGHLHYVLKMFTDKCNLQT